MKIRFAALAAALVVSSVGCTAIRPGGGCGDACAPCGMPCHVATSQRAPRATLLQGRCQCGPGILDHLGWTQRGCAECVGGCGEGCGEYADCGDGCLQHGLSTLLDCNGGCCGQGGCNGYGGPCGPGGHCGPGGYGGGPCTSSGDQNYNFNPGPPVGQTAYPYYTTRGPRDFLMCNPPSIGPR